MDHGDHGGHGGHDMNAHAMCLNWDTQIVDTCVVFPFWRIHTGGEFVVSFIAIFLLGVSFEYLRVFQNTLEAQVRENATRGKRTVSPVPASTPERESAGLLSGRRARPVGRAAIPVRFRLLSAGLYGISTLLSCFLMLVFMTYNAYLIFAVVAGAATGHYFFSGFIELNGKGMSCH